MEDHKQSRTQPGANKEEKILDLTKDMELADQDKHKIYDLSEGSDSPKVRHTEEDPLSPPPSTSGADTINDTEPAAEPAIQTSPVENKDTQVPQDAEPIDETMTSLSQSAVPEPGQAQTSVQTPGETVAFDQPEGTPTDEELPPLEERTPSKERTLSPVADSEPIEVPEEIDSAPEIEIPTTAVDSALEEGADAPRGHDHTEGDEAASSIEDEVDAAFNEVQSEPPSAEVKEVKEEPNDQLLDELSGITDMVDNTVRQINDSESPSEDISPGSIEENLTSDAAELEAAISGDDEDEIIELTEIVDPSEVMAAGVSPDGDDDEIIELVDIVDPAEMKNGLLEDEGHFIADALSRQDDLQSLTAGESEEDATSEPEPSMPESADIPTSEEEELALSDLEEFDLDEKVEDRDDEDEDFDTTEIDKLFGDDDFYEKDKPHEAAEPDIEEPELDEESEDDGEKVILLTDVLQSGPGDQKIPAEEAPKEDDIADISASSETGPEEDILNLAATPDAKEQVDLSNRDIETAVEHILKTKYADTIERLVADAVKKAVTHEVETIKRTLSDGDDTAV